MQASELGKNNNKLTGDVECINFRPSPNFKHMRKYLKSSSPTQTSDCSNSSNSDKQEPVQEEAPKSNMAQPVQPPLPPNSPPPELVIPKQEVVDEEYNDKSTINKSELKTEKNELVVEKAQVKTMCRQWARGMCTRGSTCIYVHDLILSQLPGVYTFCKNFQNTVCNYPKCKFVHATVFEKEHFYRTGFLPPHSLAHLKESNSALGPPTAHEAVPAEAPQAFSVPPPALHNSASLPTSGCPPSEVRPNKEMFGSSPSLRNGASPTKRDWTELAAPTPFAVDGGEPKKCKTCDITKMSEECAKAQLQQLTETGMMYREEQMKLAECQNRMQAVIDVLLRSNNGDLLGGLSGLSTSRIDNKEYLQNLLRTQLLKGLKERELKLPR